MERHRCKLCFKCFSNGRALGGHMRSHITNPKQPPLHHDEDHHPHHPSVHLCEDTDSAPSSSSSSQQDLEAPGDHEKGTLYYGLRENPKKSVRLVDHEFSFAVDPAFVVLPDRESETESSKNPTRRRSKRSRKLLEHHQYHIQRRQEEQRREPENNNINIKKFKFSNKTAESWIEPEPVSSISDTTTEEDVAFCLMMLSRDKWKRKEKQNHHRQEEEEEEDDDDQEEDEAEKSIEETDESEELKSCKARSRGKYRCDTCNKVFKSYQALGGHRASHKKLKPYTPIQETGLETRDKDYNYNKNNAFTSTSSPAKKIHECPYCYRVFSSGQALGGHKRSHGITAAPTIPTPARNSTAKVEDNLHLIDLNLPAPVDDDDLSQVELSAVSDAEFVNHIKR